MLDIGDGWFPDDVSSDTEGAGLGSHLRGHFLVGTYERERRVRDVICRSARSIAADLLNHSRAILGDRHHLYQRLDRRSTASPLRFIAYELQLAAQVCVRPPDLVIMAIRQRPAQAAEPHDIGMPGAGAQHFGVSSPDHKLDSMTGGQAIELSTAQREVLAIVGDRFTMQKPGRDIDELGQPPRAFRWCGPLAAEVLPLARRMTGTDSEQDAAWGEKV